MRRVVVCVIIAVVIVIGLFLYRSCHSANQLQVAPDAREEIEKAKRR
jgi:energy-converting hydrogenase Eha subunit F